MSFDPTPYVEHYRRHNARERARTQKRAEAARAEARRLAVAIASDDPSVRAVILFGSLAEGEPSHEEFDIGLAILGGDVLRAMELTEISAFRVDLVDVERVVASLRERIVTRGIVLAGAL